MPRVKKSTIEAPPWDQVEQLIGSLGWHQVQREKTLAVMDVEIDKIRQKHSQALANFDGGIAVRIGLLEAAARANPDKFAEKKSVEFLTGTLGFRTGMPQLKPLEKWTWKRVLNLLVSKKRSKFVESKPRILKDSILAAREKLGEKGLAALGVEVVQEETFYVDPKREKKDAPGAGAAA